MFSIYYFLKNYTTFSCNRILPLFDKFLVKKDDLPGEGVERRIQGVNVCGNSLTSHSKVGSGGSRLLTAATFLETFLSGKKITQFCYLIILHPICQRMFVYCANFSRRHLMPTLCTPERKLHDINIFCNFLLDAHLLHLTCKKDD